MRHISTASPLPSIWRHSAITSASSANPIAWRSSLPGLHPLTASSASIFRENAATASCASVCATAFPCPKAPRRGSSPPPTRSKCRRPEASAPGGLSLFKKRLNAFPPFGRCAGLSDAARGQCLERVIDRAKGDFGNESFRTRLRLRASCEQTSNQALDSAVETSLGNDLVHQSQPACVGCRERLAGQKVPASGSGPGRRDQLRADDPFP